MSLKITEPYFVGKVSSKDLKALHRYLEQVQQGIVHTDEWKSKMLAIHQQYLEDRAAETDMMVAWYEHLGYTVERAGNELFVTSPPPHPRKWTWGRRGRRS